MGTPKDSKGGSPIRSFALELLQHGYFHYSQQEQLDIKLSFLHIDQSIELLLKARMVEAGRPIFEKEGRTLDFMSALKSVEKLVGEKKCPAAALQMLHEQRNAIQHFGLQPDVGQRDYFLRDIAYPFLKSFLSNEFGLDIEDYLSPIIRGALEGKVATLGHRADQLLLSALGLVDVSPENAVLNARIAIEIVLGEMVQGEGASGGGRVRKIASKLMEESVLSKAEGEFVMSLMKIGAEILHEGAPVEPKVAEETIENAFRVIQKLQASGGISRLNRVRERWDEIVEMVKQKSVLAGAILSSGSPTRSADGAVHFMLPGNFTKFHVDQILSPKNKPIILEVLRDVLGEEMDFLPEVESSGK